MDSSIHIEIDTIHNSTENLSKYRFKKDFEDKNLLYDVFSSLREKINAPVRKKTN